MVKNKTIWIINQTAGKLDSGWGERHYFLSKYWIKKGYDITIFSGSYNHLFINQPQVGRKTFTKEIIERHLNFCWVKIPKYNGGSVFKLWSMFVFSLKMLFYKSKEQPSVILVSSMPIFSILSGIYLAKKFNSKLLFEIRDLWPLTPMYLSGYSKWHPIVLIMKWVEKQGYKKSNSIISLLPNANKYIDAISSSPHKFKWIPNGIDLNLKTQEPIIESIKNQIPKNKFIIGYAGTMGKANALEYFINASILLKENTDIHFILVGDGYLKNQFINKTKGNRNITFIEKIEKKYMQSMISNFDICFVGRYNIKLYDYGVSYNKYFDYMLASKPILESSNLINSPAQKAKCELTVKPEDSKSIAKGIFKLHTMTKKDLEKLGTNGKEYVLKYHNFEYLSKQYEKLF